MRRSHSNRFDLFFRIKSDRVWFKFRSRERQVLMPYAVFHISAALRRFRISSRSCFLALATCVLLVTPACQKKNNTATVQKKSKANKHAPSGIKPGSYEDWCGEHQVPESLCTRCNATLVAAFKASGDWCAEHGLPETQCLQCNPNLKITRPPLPPGKR